MPVRLENGFGMNVAIMPIDLAISEAAILTKTSRSAERQRVAVGEVDLELAVGVFVVDLIDVDADGLQRVHQASRNGTERARPL